MSRALFALLLIPGLWAQTQANVFEKAPPDVDEALRDRISKFYQAHVDRKYRQADAYVAEDSKDFFFAANKPACLSFRIDKVVYSDNFTRAKAVIVCKMRVMVPGFANTPMDVPMPDTWKVEGGQWFWYMDLSGGRDTPFGHMKPPSPDPPPDAPPPVMASIDAAMKGVLANKNAVQLSAGGQSSDEVLLANAMPGSVKLRLGSPQIPGLKVELERTELKAGEKMKVTFRREPGLDSTLKTTRVLIVADPLGMVIPIEVHLE